MRILLASLARHSASAVRHVASQVVVSVVTALCVAMITNAYLRRDQQPAPPRPAAEAEAGAPRPAVAAELHRTGDARRTASVNDERTQPAALPKLEAVYIPAVPTPATPALNLQPRSELTDPVLAESEPFPPAESARPKRVRLLGIPLPGLGAARDKVASLFGGTR